MDAQFCWTCLTTAYGDGDLVEAAEQATSLLAWLDDGNSPPETALTTPFGMGDPWDEAVTRAVCNLILSMPPEPGSNPASR